MVMVITGCCYRSIGEVLTPADLMACVLKRRVVILGGGFAGCQLAHDLERCPDIHVTLIEAGAGFTYVPDSHRAICGSCAPRSNNVNLSKLLPHAQIHLQSVTEVELDRQRLVRLQDGRELHFDYLVVATGSSYSAPIKPLSGASAAQHWRQQHDTTQQLAQATHALVLGGGIVGVELASEIVEAFPLVKLTLVTGRGGLLQGMPQAGRRIVRRWFLRHEPRAALVEGQRCTEVAPGRYMLEDGTHIDADLCLAVRLLQLFECLTSGAAGYWCGPEY